MNLVRRTLVSLLWSLIALPCVMIVSITVVPIYVARLGTGLYGAVLLAQQLANAAAALVPQPGDALLQRLAASHGAGRRTRMRELLGTGMRATSLAAGLIFALGALALAVAPLLPAASAGIARVLAVFLLALALRSVADGVANVLSALQRPSFIGAANTLAAVAGPLLGVGLIIVGVGGYAIPAATAVVAALLCCSLYLRLRAVEPELSSTLPPFSREVFFRELWPLTRARWLSVIPTALGPGSDRVIAGVTSGSSASITSFALTGRLPDLLAMILPSIAGSAVPALAYASDARDRNPLGASRDLLALVIGLAAGASAACLAVLGPFLVLWVPSVTPLGPWARAALCLALLGRSFGASGTAVLNGFGRNQSLPRLSWINAVATIVLGATGGILGGLDGVAIGFGAAALFVLLPLTAHALAAEGIVDAATLRRFAALSLACGAVGYGAPWLVLSSIGAIPHWWALGLAVGAAGLGAACALLGFDASLRSRLTQQLRPSPR